MLVSIGAMLYVFFATSIAWTWYVFLGSLITFVVAWVASFAFSASSAQSLRPLRWDDINAEDAEIAQRTQRKALESENL